MCTQVRPDRSGPCLSKKHTLLLLVSETFGGINNEALRYLRTLAARAGKAGCPDRTKYGTRARRLSFFEHYARRLSAAAIIGDAHVSHKVEEELRQRLARALAARTLDALQVEHSGADAGADAREPRSVAAASGTGGQSRERLGAGDGGGS